MQEAKADIFRGTTLLGKYCPLMMHQSLLTNASVVNEENAPSVPTENYLFGQLLKGEKNRFRCHLTPPDDSLKNSDDFMPCLRI